MFFFRLKRLAEEEIEGVSVEGRNYDNHRYSDYDSNAPHVAGK